MRLSRLLRSTSAAAQVNRFTNRTHNCGQLRAADSGQPVQLFGWLSFKRMDRFFGLKDAYGTTQVLVPPELHDTVRGLPHESVLAVRGRVRARGKDRNPQMPTGDVEVLLEELQVLNRAPAELALHEKVEARERTKLSNRCLHLRTPALQRNLRFRSALTHRLRRCLVEELGFVDLETPTLSQWTPGGAHEFIVPAGKALKGLFYTLPQSPQVFKQLLMVGGFDRYFQFARCYRDEGSKLDRQPEFTQLDLELSFAGQQQVMQLVERLLLAAWPEELKQFTPNTPFRRMSFDSAVRDYGSDKPDLRIPWKIVDVTQELSCTPLRPAENADNWTACAFVAQQTSECVTPAKVRAWKQLLTFKDPQARFQVADLSKKCPFKGLDSAEFSAKHGVKQGDLVVFSWGAPDTCRATLGELRNLLGEAAGLKEAKQFEWLWVVDFPLFSRESDGRLVASHHPFTAPAPEDEARLRAGQQLDQLKAQHYDLVLNGVELGGGSVRIHDVALQKLVIDTLQLPWEPLASFVQSLATAPPHAGLALGLDRLVAVLCAQGNTNVSIRDVIAFPKSKEGRCASTGAPGAPPADVLARYGLRRGAEPRQFIVEE